VNGCLATKQLICTRSDVICTSSELVMLDSRDLSKF